MNRGNELPAFAFCHAAMVPNLEQHTSQRTQRYNSTKGKRDDSLVKQASHKHSSQTHADYKHDFTANSPFKPSVYWSPSWTCVSKTKSKQLFHFLGYHSSSTYPCSIRLHGDHQTLMGPQEGQRTKRTHSRVILITFVSSMISSSPRDCLRTPQSPQHFGATHKNLADQYSSWAAQTAQCQR